MNDLSQRLAELSPAKRDLLLQKLRESAAGVRRAEIAPVPREGRLELSFAQERLWFLAQLDPESPAYNISAALRLQGPLRVAALSGALAAVVRRHETLRTVFQAEDGVPAQVISPKAEPELPLVDLGGLAAADREREAAALIRAEARRPFDLERGPLLRACLLRLAPAEHLLIFNLHHLVGDGWSIGVLVRELVALYRGAPLPALPVQYADVAHWQRSWLEGVSADQLAYWRKRLAGAPLVLELPADRPRPARPSLRGAARRFTFGAELSAAVRELARAWRVGPFAVLLSAFQALLSRYTGQLDVLVGSPVAGRTHIEVEGLIGMFVNTLVLRADLAGDPTFAAVLEQAGETVLAAQEHQDLPFERLVDELQPERSLAYAPVVQAMLGFQISPLAALRLPDLLVTPVEVDSGTAKFDLTLLIEYDGEVLRGTCTYPVEIFEGATVTRLLRHFETLLASATKDPERCLSELSLLPRPECQQLLWEWNDTAAAWPREACLHELIERQVELSGQAVAVVCAGEALTYAELDVRANRWARTLRHAGVRAETLVGVCLERSPEMVVALLAVLKAGGAYVPIDPSYPEERLAYMLVDSQAKVLLTQERLVPRLPSLQQGGARLLCLEALDGRAGEEESCRPPHSGATLDSAAYAIYTSGSTGRPKGVINTHRGIVNRLLWMQGMYGLEPEDRVLQKTPFSFDVSVWELFWPLLTGARLVMARPEGHQDPAYLARLIAEEGITTVHFVPSMLRLFLQEPGVAGCSSLRRVIASGEALSSALRDRFFQQLPAGVELYNLYGPTEAAVDVTFEACAPDNPEAGVPIGRPVANTCIHLLDRAMEVVPIGVTGELHIGGVQLARGYLNRPELTAERFVPDPWLPGARLYRTGDLARRLPDGRVEYLGRLDFQVKIRGVRVELGEIEAALRAHPALTEAVVVARPDRTGDPRLIAYLVAAGPIPGIAELRAFLLQKLPEPMVPSGFVPLAALPLSPNGKVDRAALPEPEASRLGAERVFTPPRTPLEELLAGVWADLLGAERVGVHDNFFELGGHSLLAVRLASRVRELTGVDLPLRAVFETPTVAGLAEHAQTAGSGRPLPAIERSPRGDGLPLSFAQERLWYLDQLDGGSATYNLPVSVSLYGDLDPAALESALRELVRRHETLRTMFVSDRGRPLQMVAAAPPLSLSVVDLRRLAGAEQAAAVRRLEEGEASRVFDLAAGPLFSALLVRLGDAEHLLSICLHHIVADGWSIGVLTRELAALYAADHLGRPSPLPELAVQYADYAVWQRRQLDGEALAGQLGYWRRQLAGAPPLLDLPTDRPRPAVQTYRGRQWTALLPPLLTARLKTLGASQRATLFMTLLAAFEIVLGRWSGQEDVVVGTPIAGRGRGELEPLIGLFLNSLALRADLAGEPSFRELLERVRRTALEAYSNQDVPFEKLLEELRPERDLSRTPLFQVFFNMLNFPLDRIEVPGLRIEARASVETASKFDLTVYLAERDGGVRLHLVYNADLFDDATIVALSDQLASLLAQAAEAPEEKIGGFDLGIERTRGVLPDPGRPLADVWRGAVHEIFARRAAEAPHRLAAADPGESWTYGELDAQSNRLAHWLIDRGVEPGEVVTLYGHRSATLVWSVLGVLKAGAAFVILDPTYPAGRLIDCLKLARPRAWIEIAAAGPLPGALEAFVAGLPGCARLRVARRSAGPGPLSGLPATAPGRSVGPDDLALIAFTSGSTGAPKGILGRQGPLSQFVPWQCREFGFSAEDRFCMLSGLAHDPLQRDIFTPLQIGAAVCIPDPERMGSPGWLAGWMAGERITVAHLTPAMGQLLTEANGAGGARVPSLRYVFLVGDALTRRDADRLRELAPAVTCVNFYGSTETQRSVGYYVVNDPAVSAGQEDGSMADGGRQVLPLGQGIEGVQLLVLNAAGRLAGVGELGEVCVRSHHLARGYLDDPGLTAARFLVNPFTGQANDRLYRTGDLGRYRADGNVVFAGRADQQVKIRGFRIELGEIEAVLGRHPALLEAVVVAREDRPGDRRLVAYCVFREGGDAAAAELRGYLHERLPDYMVPSAFVRLAALPLTPNRKVDRRALPPPPAGGEETVPFTPPRDELERLVARIWGEVLRVERVGAEDNFFELGGHSLLATQLAARLRDAVGIELPLRTLFEAPTVAGMARAIAAAGAASGGAPADLSLPLIVPDAGRRHVPFPLTDVQQAYWIGRTGAFELGNVSTHVYVEFEGDGIDVERFAAAWRRLIERHDMLRAVVLPDGRQQILDAVPPYEIAILDLAAAPPAVRERELAAVRGEMSHQVLPADRWPLFDFRASRLPAGGVRLHLSMDLLIGDALSFRILERELLQLYRDPEASLPPLSLSFRDYVLADHALAETAPYRRALEYWRGRLETLPPAPELPLAINPAALERPRFTRRVAGLEPAIWRRLKQRAHRAGLTPSVLLLAAFSEVLAAWSKSPRFTLTLTLFNRLPLHPQVNEIVGDFTSVTLLEVDGATAESFEDRARRLQRQLWSDIENRLVSGVRVLRDARRAAGAGGITGAMPVVFTSTLGLPQRQSKLARSLLGGEAIYSISQTPQVWLDHQATEYDGALRVVWDAVEELFPAGLLDGAFASYQALLLRLAEREESWRAHALTELPDDQLRLRREVNATAAPVPPGLLHQGFLDQAALDPRATAVISPSRTLSYGELYARSRDLAARLRRLGARPNTLVGVVMEKGWEQIAAVLGILQAGAAYLPIDPGVPRERLFYLLEHGQAEIALTQSWLDEELAWPAGVARLAVDTLEPLEGGEPPLPPAQTPEDLAYVIFTSGSTGLPKGVMIDHRGALNTVVDVNQRFRVGPGDRVLALSALNFDLSVWDIFGVLAAGGAVVLPESSAVRDPARWAELVAQEEVTLWDTVPALMEMLVEYAASRGERLSSLRAVMLSGDWIPVTLPDRIRQVAPAAGIVSMGGATEASIWSILYPIEAVDPEWKSIPYGRPMVNQRFYVLDEKLQPRPTWVPGQLHISGIGLALGYWRDEEKTRGSFVTHPDTGERLYRTGDLGRYLPSGDIEFLGREDFQVKIQGYRIELGEIEAALALHPGVQAAAVSAVGARSNQRLVAYVVPVPGAAGPPPPPPRAAAVSGPSGDALRHQMERLDHKLRHSAVRDEPHRPSVQLVRPPRTPELLAAYERRRSQRAYPAEPVPFAALDRLLQSLLPVELEARPLPKYRYASAGNLYPVQVYLYCKPGRVQGLAGGAYYYHPGDHRLVLLSADAVVGSELHAAVNRALVDESAFTLFLIGDLDGITPLYGESSRDFCLLEAGYVSQLLMTEAAESGIGLCPIGRLDFAPARHFFALRESHILLHALAGGSAEDGSAPSLPVVDSRTVSAAPSGGLTTEELRSFLESKLPRYMVPASFVYLDALPLTANGKVDRKAFPEPAAETEPGSAFVAPQGEVEQILARVIQEILQVETIGVHDNFFELGGTSVHIVRAHARLRETFGQEIPIVEMFSHPTVSALARRLARPEAPPVDAEPADSQPDEGRARLRQRLDRSRRSAEDDAGE
jgi:amino acid adenylation domain-containing protein